MDVRHRASVAGLPSAEHGMTSVPATASLAGRKRSCKVLVLGKLVSRDGRFMGQARVGPRSTPITAGAHQVWWDVGLQLQEDTKAAYGRVLSSSKDIVVTTCLLLSGWLHEQKLLKTSWEGHGETPARCQEPQMWRKLMGQSKVRILKTSAASDLLTAFASYRLPACSLAPPRGPLHLSVSTASTCAGLGIGPSMRHSCPRWLTRHCRDARQHDGRDWRRGYCSLRVSAAARRTSVRCHGG